MSNNGLTTKDFLQTALEWNEDHCLIWPFTIGESNINSSYTNGGPTVTKMRRTVCEHFHGPAPFDGAEVCHHPKLCNNALCFSWKHLRWGSKSENRKDRKQAGTDFYAPPKLSKDEVRQMFREFFAGSTKVELARKYGVNHSHVCNIINGTGHSHLDIWREFNPIE